MARTICCLFVALLTTGVAQSAPPPETISASHPLRIRFLSLAEARAIAVERGGIESQTPGPVRVFARPGHKGMLITGVSHDPKRDEYERNINQVLLNVETAYWNLYGSYWQMHSREQALRFAYDTWKIAADEYRNDEASLADFAQAQGQYELFRSQRLQALDTVLDNERQLRAMLGLPIADGKRLVPSGAPTLVEKNPAWQEALTYALKKRPVLRLARKDVEVAEAKVRSIERILPSPGRCLPPVEVNAAEDKMVPYNVMTCAAWDYGAMWMNSARNLARLHDAERQLQRSRLVLQDQELKTERFLGLEYRRLSSAYFQIEAARAQRKAFATQLRLRDENYRQGKKDAALDLLLESHRFWADAQDSEYQSIVTYNNAIAGWEYAKGNIMTRACARFGAEPSSVHKLIRAVVREHKRTRQHVRRVSAVLADSPLTVPDEQSFAAAPSLPALWKSFPPLRSAEKLPPVESNPLKAGMTETRLSEWKMSDIFPPL